MRLVAASTFYVTPRYGANCQTFGFEGDFAVGMPNGDRNKFGVRFAFEYRKLLKQNLLYFIGLGNYLTCSIFTSLGTMRGQGIIRVVVVVVFLISWKILTVN